MQIIEDLLLYDFVYPPKDDPFSHVGANFKILDMLAKLEEEPDSFWVNLFKKWLLSPHLVQRLNFILNVHSFCAKFRLKFK